MSVQRDQGELTRILDGKRIARQIRDEVGKQSRQLIAGGARPPGLVAVLVGEDPASQVYVRTKSRAADEAGFHGRTLKLPEAIQEEALIQRIEELNRDEEVDGILVQLPLPSGLNQFRVLDTVVPEKDVDGFHPQNVGRLWLDREGFLPATPAGIMELLRRSEISLEGLHAVVVGRSSIVGKPIAGLLLRSHCTVTVCHSRTRDLKAVCRRADLLIAAVGRPAFIGEDHVSPGCVVIDVGINRIHSRAEVERLFPKDGDRMAQFEERGSILVGDVDFTRVAPQAGAITPVPGGVGPLTVAMLLANTLKASAARQGLPLPAAEELE